MKVRTCNCEHCRYRKKRQNKHGTSIITVEKRAARRIVRQKLKASVAREGYEIDLDPYRNIPPLA